MEDLGFKYQQIYTYIDLLIDIFLPDGTPEEDIQKAIDTLTQVGPHGNILKWSKNIADSYDLKVTEVDLLDPIIIYEFAEQILTNKLEKDREAATMKIVFGVPKHK